jgi:transcriptional regulator with XRE-family HTH domain
MRKRTPDIIERGADPFDIGAKIRSERKRLRLSIESLAEKIGISKMKLQRIETGASSPSIVLLTQIAHHLKRPVESFVRDGKASAVHLKKKQQDALSDKKRGFRIIGPVGLISDKITLTYQELEKDTITESHTNEGIEWAYIIEGSAIFEINEEKFLLEEGDSICFDARVPHSTRVIETIKCIGLFQRGE